MASHANAQIISSQKPIDQIPVSERVPEDLRATGYYMGSFIVHPKLQLNTKYDSNIYALNKNEKSDISTNLTPSVSILKNYKDHYFSLDASANIEHFFDNSSENNQRYSIEGRANLIGNNHWNFPIEVSRVQNVRNRERPLAESTPDKRLAINKNYAAAGVTRRFNRLSITLLGNYADFSFDDGFALNNNSRVVFSDNDRTRYGGLLRFRYDLPRSDTGTDFENIAFTNLTYGKNKYDKLDFQKGQFKGPNQNHDEYGFLAGFMTNYKGLIKASIGAGTTHLSFDDARLKDSNTTNLAADIAYTLTPKMTINFDAKRDRDQDTGLAEGVITSQYGVGLDYELRHNFYAGAGIGYSQYDFDTIGRKDDDYSGSLYLRYLNSRHLESELRLNYRDRQSTDPQREFDRFEVIFSLVGKI